MFAIVDTVTGAHLVKLSAQGGALFDSPDSRRAKRYRNRAQAEVAWERLIASFVPQVRPAMRKEHSIVTV
jgi:hypothetical protein